MFKDKWLQTVQTWVPPIKSIRFIKLVGISCYIWPWITQKTENGVNYKLNQQTGRSFLPPSLETSLRTGSSVRPPDTRRQPGTPSHPHSSIPALDPNWVDPRLRSSSPPCSSIRWSAARSTSGRCNEPGACRGNGFHRIFPSVGDGVCGRGFFILWTCWCHLFQESHEALHLYFWIDSN